MRFCVVLEVPKKSGVARLFKVFATAVLANFQDRLVVTASICLHRNMGSSPYFYGEYRDAPCLPQANKSASLIREQQKSLPRPPRAERVVAFTRLLSSFVSLHLPFQYSKRHPVCQDFREHKTESRSALRLSAGRAPPVMLQECLQSSVGQPGGYSFVIRTVCPFSPVFASPDRMQICNKSLFKAGTSM